MAHRIHRRRAALPLNHLCSRKWAIPDFLSCFGALPAAHQKSGRPPAPASVDAHHTHPLGKVELFWGAGKTRGVRLEAASGELCRQEPAGMGGSAFLLLSSVSDQKPLPTPEHPPLVECR